MARRIVPYAIVTLLFGASAGWGYYRIPYYLAEYATFERPIRKRTPLEYPSQIMKETYDMWIKKQKTNSSFRVNWSSRATLLSLPTNIQFTDQDADELLHIFLISSPGWANLICEDGQAFTHRNRAAIAYSGLSTKILHQLLAFSFPNHAYYLEIEVIPLAEELVFDNQTFTHSMTLSSILVTGNFIIDFVVKYITPFQLLVSAATTVQMARAIEHKYKQDS